MLTYQDIARIVNGETVWGWSLYWSQTTGRWTFRCYEATMIEPTFDTQLDAALWACEELGGAAIETEGHAAEGYEHGGCKSCE